MLRSFGTGMCITVSTKHYQNATSVTKTMINCYKFTLYYTGIHVFLAHFPWFRYLSFKLSNIYANVCDTTYQCFQYV